MNTRFVRFLAKNMCIGVMVGWGILLLLLLSNLGGVRTLLFKSDSTVLAIGLLMVGFAITFGNCAMGIAAVKSLPKQE